MNRSNAAQRGMMRSQTGERTTLEANARSSNGLNRFGRVGHIARSLTLMALTTLAMSFAVWAQDAPEAAKATGKEAAPKLDAPLTALKLDTGDTAWVLAAAALVLLMTPGLAFFYGGLVRSKNMLNTLLMSFGAMAALPIVWMLAAYSIAFGDGGGLNNVWGGLQFAGLNGVDTTTAHSLAATIPHQAFMIFQMMFFLITPALISGSLVERMKFTTFLTFIVLWGLLVYAPVAHWVWGGGFIGADIGALDFAGGAVVHVNAGFAALAGALALGPRKGYGQSSSMRPTCRVVCWASACCGSAGMALTPARLWARVRWRLSLLSTRLSARPRRC